MSEHPISAVIADLRAAGVPLQQTIGPSFKIRVSAAMEAEIKLWGLRRGIRTDAAAIRQLIAIGLATRPRQA